WKTCGIIIAVNFNGNMSSGTLLPDLDGFDSYTSEQRLQCLLRKASHSWSAADKDDVIELKTYETNKLSKSYEDYIDWLKNSDQTNEL
ncbi:MAG: hypothetical protein MHPSP_003489, partial [Paramarteilia canceri]